MEETRDLGYVWYHETYNGYPTRSMMRCIDNINACIDIIAGKVTGLSDRLVRSAPTDLTNYRQQLHEMTHS